MAEGNTNLLSVYQVNSADGTISNPVDVTTLVTTNDRTTAQIKLAAETPGKLQVGNTCWAFRIDNFVYSKNPTGTEFTQLPIVSSLIFGIFDSSLNFVYASNKIYKFATTDYVEILNVTGLFSKI